jgi:hypothetical protein
MRLVEAMHATAPIVDIPAAHLRRSHTPAGEWREIIGIESFIDAADSRQLLWAELDVPWAQRVVALAPRNQAVQGGAA